MIGAGYGLGAAALFGASAPLSKLLLGHAGPLIVSAFLYLGAAAGLFILQRVSSRVSIAKEAALRGRDFALLSAITILGGIAGPILMLYGLTRVSALAGSLALNLEAPFTIIIAVVLFREYLGSRAILAALLIIGGTILLGWAPGSLRADSLGIGSIAAACLCWGIDNNLTQRLSLRDPAAIATIKAAVAGLTTLTIAFAIGMPSPGIGIGLAALAIGSVCYGLSLYLDVLALRMLGAAREAAYFASAPFIGAILSLAIFRMLPGTAEWIAAASMAIGVALLIRENHNHAHVHDELVHDHLHYHDRHHLHAHLAGESPHEPHAHPHRHSALRHAHPHVSDLHHRHPHGG
ncbi:MAG: EamA family transporter [Candidatus Binataceae bacterium]|nr:EamA family transporter [Candidatus Binataceae bacterium]